MEFASFVRKPFAIEAIEITKANIAELAPLLGELKFKDDGEPYIEVDKERIPNLFRVSPGHYMTKMNGNYRCYSRKIFRQQFIPVTPEIQDLVEAVTAKKNTQPPTAVSSSLVNNDDALPTHNEPEVVDATAG